jgi:hypothetical protein
MVKSCGSTIRLLFELNYSRIGEASGIFSVGVKSVDTRRNTNGVGRMLAYF